MLNKSIYFLPLRVWFLSIDVIYVVSEANIILLYNCFTCIVVTIASVSLYFSMQRRFGHLYMSYFTYNSLYWTCYQYQMDALHRETLCVLLGNKRYQFIFTVQPPPRCSSGRVLASNAGSPGFNPQSRTASYQRPYKNGTSSSLV